MLRITIDPSEQWDEEREEFVYTKGQILSLEHSLVSVSKWESKWGKPFISKEPISLEETIDYIRCMTITQNINPKVYGFLTNKDIDVIQKYIDAPMTATTFFDFDDDANRSSRRHTITAELIYYWMITLNIPLECQKWHLNSLLTLIRLCSVQNAPKKKLSKNEIRRRNEMINEARKKQFNTRG